MSAIDFAHAACTQRELDFVGTKFAPGMRAIHARNYILHITSRPMQRRWVGSRRFRVIQIEMQIGTDKS